MHLTLGPEMFNQINLIKEDQVGSIGMLQAQATYEDPGRKISARIGCT
jgi:hypothetical protein